MSRARGSRGRRAPPPWHLAAPRRSFPRGREQSITRTRTPTPFISPNKPLRRPAFISVGPAHAGGGGVGCMGVRLVMLMTFIIRRVELICNNFITHKQPAGRRSQVVGSADTGSGLSSQSRVTLSWRGSQGQAGPVTRRVCESDGRHVPAALSSPRTRRPGHSLDPRTTFHGSACWSSTYDDNLRVEVRRALDRTHTPAF